MRAIGVVTVSRSDYGIYLPVLRRIQADPDLELRLLVGGMHMEPAFGTTVDVIQADGFDIRARVEMQMSGGMPQDIAMSLGIGVQGFADAYTKDCPDMLVVLGDRFDMFAAAIAAVPFHIPIAHIHGGESTEAVIDEAIRHSITKMSHLHFVSTELYGHRVIQMGEEPWRVTVTGAPSLDHLQTLHLLDRQALSQQLGVNFDQPTLLVTFHPVTLAYERTREYVVELLAALDAIGMPVIFTYPNADTQGRTIINMLTEFIRTRSWATACVNLGTEVYFSLMQHVAAMVGNSSSGIIEAASLGLPVVNIGARQRGRLHGRNVLATPCRRAEISTTIQRACSPAFRHSLIGLTNLYGDGHASERIVERLKSVALDERLLMKRWHPQVDREAWTGSVTSMSATTAVGAHQ